MAKGKKTGGRKSGSRNKRNVLLDRIVKANKTTPLEYMLSVMRNEKTEPSRRDEMAKAAAPYIHSKKATSLEVSGKDGGPLRVKTEFDFAEYERLFETHKHAGAVLNGNGTQQPLHSAHTDPQTGSIP